MSRNEESDDDQSHWWSECGFWEQKRREWEESGSPLDFNEWCEKHLDAR